MYIDIVPNRNSPPAILIRESCREGKKVVKRTIANISHWEPERIETLKKVLAGKKLVEHDELFETVTSYHHGHGDAVLLAMKRLGIDKLLGTRPSKERSLVMAMICARILAPASKLAVTRWWKDTTIPSELGIEDADEDDLYEAMDWLLARQEKIERKLAARHLHDGGMVLYDLSSSYMTGDKCPIARYGYSRDGKRGTLQIEYGLVTDRRGVPVSVSVFPGNTADPATIPSQIEKLREKFGLEKIVLVGDRGMLTERQINQELRPHGIDWITALRSGAIRSLVRDGAVQPSLFDTANLFAFTHPDYPGERLIACLNPFLAKHRALKRASLIEATIAELDKVKAAVDAGRLTGRDRIGLRVGKLIGKHMMAKHIVLDIGDTSLTYRIDEDKVREESSLDGIYVVRTSLPEAAMDAPEAVRSYKRLAEVERAFRSLKTFDLAIRPIRHYTEPRVKAHVFLCMLAYYVTWHMKDALKPMLFAEEEPDPLRDPVAPPPRSLSARKKDTTKRTVEGEPVHSFRTLLANLSTIVRNICRRKGDPTSPPTIIVSTPTPLQKKAFDLIAKIRIEVDENPSPEKRTQ